ncbi:MAG: energy transducer TonB [Bacteroidia bacterium]
MPLFPGGKESLDKFIADNLNRPTSSWRGQGKVHIEFKVDSVGHICNITVLKGFDFLATHEALRVVGLMPAWIPGTCDGKGVDIWYEMPIKFKW